MRREERGAGRTTRPDGFDSHPPHQAEDDASAPLRGKTPALPLNPIPGAGGPLLEGGLFHGRVAQWQRGRLISGMFPVQARARPPQPLGHGRLKSSEGKAERRLAARTDGRMRHTVWAREHRASAGRFGSGLPHKPRLRRGLQALCIAAAMLSTAYALLTLLFVWAAGQKL